VRLGSVTIDSGSRLGAEVAVPGVEIECTDAVFAASTLELHSPFDAIGGVASHGLIVVLCLEGRTHHGGLSKVVLSRSMLCDRSSECDGLVTSRICSRCPKRVSMPRTLCPTK
jgi:hypothetical protein